VNADVAVDTVVVTLSIEAPETGVAALKFLTAGVASLVSFTAFVMTTCGLTGREAV
jgi:hypothetical protein